MSFGLFQVFHVELRGLHRISNWTLCLIYAGIFSNPVNHDQVCVCVCVISIRIVWISCLNFWDEVWWLNNGHGSKFRVGSLVPHQTHEKDRREYQPKRCEYKNENEDKSSKTLNNKNNSLNIAF